MSDPTFIHLRLHSEFSIVDGIVRIDEAVQRASTDAMPALALTDLGNTFALVKMYSAARAKGIKPIIGCDVWITNEVNRDQASRLASNLRLRWLYKFRFQRDSGHVSPPVRHGNILTMGSA